MMTPLIFLGFAQSSSTQATMPPQPDIAKIVFEAVDGIKPKPFASYSVGVLRDGKMVYSTELKNGKVEVSGKQFRIGSVTKQFTSGLIIMLVREKKMGLEDPLAKFIPEVPKEWKQVTVRQLLDHTSGIPSYTNSPKFWPVVLKPTKPDGIWQLMVGEKMDFEPGKGWKYNNTAYTILGSIIERVTKKSYWKVLDERILRPLGMKNTGQEQANKLIPGYDGDGKPAMKLNMDWPYSAGSMVSTVADLGKWDAALRGTKLFSNQEKKVMWTPSERSLAIGEPYGFAWDTDFIGQECVKVAHGGSIPGFDSYITRSLKKGYSVIVLSNRDASDADGIAETIMLNLEPELRVVARAIDDAAPELTRKHKNLLERMMRSEATAEDFDPKFLAQVPLSVLHGTSSQFAQFGGMKAFYLIDVRDDIRSYRVTFGVQDKTLLVRENKEGKIIAMLIR